MGWMKMPAKGDRRGERAGEGGAGGWGKREEEGDGEFGGGQGQ